MLASKIRRREAIPGEPGEWLDLRAPGGRTLEEARRLGTLQHFAAMRAMGTDMLEALQAASGPSQASAEPDPLLAYDLDTLLRGSIVAWSYSEKINPASIADLDERTRKWAAGLILGLCRETEGERGEG